VQAWRRIGSTRLQRCRVFDLDVVRFERPGGRTTGDYYRIETPDWINVIPLDADGRVIFVRQFRVGVCDLTLEIPGGVCEPGEAPRAAAERELLEETGHAARELVALGWVHPNPALQGNRCFSFLARDVVRVGPAQPDPDEILEIARFPLEDVPRLIREGQITHSLVVNAFHMLLSA
jgi:8-oxo-dGTP pyrophosphatase MutT (NUDIX family)